MKIFVAVLGVIIVVGAFVRALSGGGGFDLPVIVAVFIGIALMIPWIKATLDQYNEKVK